MTKVNCIIVTYNRLNLLKECIEAVKRQTYPINRIVIIDNHSTDDTANFLKGFLSIPQYHIIRTESNIGGAGGFSLGIKESVMIGCDFSWIMDDDTIPEPDALEKLIKATSATKMVGFVCSRVNWTDGTPHIMNRPSLCNKKDYNQKNKQFIPRCYQCSFVSVLISTQSVRKVGLPIKEFFIWCDDIEYTSRISDAGFINYYVEDSIVLHKTIENYYPSIDKVPIQMSWRIYYQVRNTCYIKHRKTRFSLFFYLSVWNKYRIMKRRIMKRKDGNYKEFIDAVKKGCKDGLTFYPEIEYL